MAGQDSARSSSYDPSFMESTVRHDAVVNDTSVDSSEGDEK
jgi:hypothetical protein